MRGRYWLPLLVIIILLIVVGVERDPSGCGPSGKRSAFEPLSSSSHRPTRFRFKRRWHHSSQHELTPSGRRRSDFARLIPDWLANRHFIMAIAQPQTPSAEQTARRATLC